MNPINGKKDVRCNLGDSVQCICGKVQIVDGEKFIPQDGPLSKGTGHLHCIDCGEVIVYRRSSDEMIISFPQNIKLLCVQPAQ